MSNLRTGGQILVDQLKIHGADLAFCVPGESYLAVLDALFDARVEIHCGNTELRSDQLRDRRFPGAHRAGEEEHGG